MSNYSYNSNYQSPYQYNAYKQMGQFFFVNGLEGAKQYPVLPNQTILLMDSANPIIYNKKSNSLGQATLECFKIVPINENEIITNNQNQSTNNEYASKEDILSINNKLDMLFSKLNIKEGE